VLGRVTLPGLSLEAPVSQVMSAPVAALDASHTAQDAVLLMSRRTLRHVPVLDNGQVVNVVSERDLFALQRLSIKHLGTAIRRASRLSEFQEAAQDIRAFTRHLLGQGVQARQLTALISHLNDLLTERLVEVELAASGLSAQRMCWVALGSEGRAEQTIATDQDNALVFESDDPERDRPQWLAFARRVNEALDACGYPLCKGGVMACNPPCCLTAAEWEARFMRWIEQGGAQDLLHASIFFDFRAVAGQAAWLEPLRERVVQRAAATPRFIRQLAQNHADHPVPLNWHGGVDGKKDGDHLWLDLKLQATALLVDAARIVALAQGLSATGTRERLLQAGERLRVPAEEREAWATAFDYLQMQRLVRQLAGDSADQPNRIDLNTLNAVDQKVLKASLQAIKTLQQRLALDYLR
jgi:CBS domain-containing protein